MRCTIAVHLKISAFLCLGFLHPGYADERTWLEPFFVEAGGQSYLMPELFSGLLESDPGFRVALGYEYKRFRFAAESGYTHISGINPIVLDLQFVPVFFKIGYSLPIWQGFGVQADAGAGLLFSRTIHYSDAINMFTDKKQDSQIRSFLAQAQAYGTYTFPGSFLRLYAGGGIDFLFETAGLIPLPLVTIGISLKPFAIGRERTAAVLPEERTQEEPPAERAAEPPIETAAIEEPLRLVWLALFPPDGIVPSAEGLSAIDEAGTAFSEYRAERIILRGYAAPYKSVSGQTEVSRQRALYCAVYLMEKFGIPEEQLVIEWHGAQSVPENTDEDSHSMRRSTEIIFEGRILQ